MATRPDLAILPAEGHVTPAGRGADQHILIGVCTRQRNALLRRLINSIQTQPLPSGYSVEILVIDNNDEPMTLQNLVGLPARFPISVVHERHIGLVHARNRALDEATTRGADWFVGVDDDEWVASDWLAEVVAGTQTATSPVMIAPCRYVYEGLSHFLTPWQLPQRPLGSRPLVMATSNFVIHRRVFDKTKGAGLRFDLSFNECGGEDLEFFLRAERVHGWVPYWLPDAIVYENWNGNRATLRYRLTRTLRIQISAYQVARLHRRLGIHGSRAGNIMRVLLRVNRHTIYGAFGMICGLAMFPFRPGKGRHLIGGALERGARAIAVLPFIFQKTPVAYGAQVEAQ